MSIRYCRTCYERRGKRVWLTGWMEVLRHIWQEHLTPYPPYTGKE